MQQGHRGHRTPPPSTLPHATPPSPPHMEQVRQSEQEAKRKHVSQHAPAPRNPTPKVRTRPNKVTWLAMAFWRALAFNLRAILPKQLHRAAAISANCLFLNGFGCVCECVCHISPLPPNVQNEAKISETQALPSCATISTDWHSSDQATEPQFPQVPTHSRACPILSCQSWHVTTFLEH